MWTRWMLLTWREEEYSFQEKLCKNNDGVRGLCLSIKDGKPCYRGCRVQKFTECMWTLLQKVKENPIF